MRWEHLLPVLQLHMLTRGQPAATMIYVGGNSIASILQFTLMKACFQLTLTGLVSYSDILPRLVWRHNKNDNLKALYLKTQRINRAVHQYMTEFSFGRVIRLHILWYMTEMFDNDETHLSEFGNLTYVQTFRNFIHTIINNGIVIN